MPALGARQGRREGKIEIYLMPIPLQSELPSRCEQVCWRCLSLEIHLVALDPSPGWTRE
jgi:hypothetical protein